MWARVTLLVVVTPPEYGERMATTHASEVGQSKPFGSSDDLWFHRRHFAGVTTVQIMVPMLVCFLAWRIYLGDWQITDVYVAFALIAFQPFTEWLIHVGILHWKPRKIAGVPIDLHAAKKHRGHHLDPNDVPQIFIPLFDLATLIIGVGVALIVLLPRPELMVTGAVVGTALALTYEWTHYLIHTAYRPKSQWYRAIWRSHRLHHYRNEHYWFGVTNNIGDRVLGTNPDKTDVPASDTARTLGVDTPAT